MDVLSIWNRCQSFPAGKYLFNVMVGKKVPYTGSIGASVLDLKPGYSRVQLKDRKKVRNHLNSVHAVALMNLGEFSSGLAFLAVLPKGAKAILTKFSIEFIKKARGTLTAETHCESISIQEGQDHTVVADVKNEAQEVVARVTALWRVSLKK